MKKNTNNQFLIGSWVSFYSFDKDSYEHQLDQMKEAGLNFNIFPIGTVKGMKTEEIWNLVEQQYAARDMLYFMRGGHNDETMATAVENAKGKAHCIGYYLKDEPGGAALPEVGRYVRAHREADGERYPFVNLFPSYAGEVVMEGNYYEYCSRYVREAGAENIEYLSHDFYPFHAKATCVSIFADMDVVRRVALENGRLRTHAFPQSSAWNGIRMPNIDEMRWNVYAYLAYGFKALSWFNLVCPGNSDTEGEGFYDSLIYRDGTIRNPQLFKDFGALNHEVLTLGDTLLKLDAIHAYHTKGGIAGVERLPADWMITPAGDDDFVISHMVSKKGDETYVMLFNKDWENPVTASFKVSAFSGIESLDYVSPFDGSASAVSVEDGLFTETFRPGEGKLYKLNGKLSYRVLSLDDEHPRLEVDLPAATSLNGVDVTCSLCESGTAVTAQICTNKKFTENKTTSLEFETCPADGKLRFEPIVGKYLRLSFGTEEEALTCAQVELRVRFTDEPEERVEEAAQTFTVREPAPVIIPLGSTLEEAQSLLPKHITVLDAEGVAYEGAAKWDLTGFDASLSGARQLEGTVMVASADAGIHELSAQVSITVTYDVNYTNLDEALAVVDELVESDFTPDSWSTVREYYDAALAMKDGTYPQNAVTVAYWQLLDRVRELEPVKWVMSDPVADEPIPAQAREHEHGEKAGLHVSKGVLPAAVATFAGAVAGILAGVLASKSKKKRK